MRGSDLHRRYIDRITAIAKGTETSADGKLSIESVVRQFQSETMPLAQAPFRMLCEEMSAELEAKAQGQADEQARDALLLAAKLLRAL